MSSTDLQEGIQNFEIQRLNGESRVTETDQVAIEAPLEMRVNGESISITMRTPGADPDLAKGFLYTEGIISGAHEIASCTQSESDIIELRLTAEANFNSNKLQRHFYTSSSCGVCGKTSIDLVKQKCPFDIGKAAWTIEHQKLFGFQDRLRISQGLFEQTGGIHAAALFDREPNLLHVAEDVGRHNALDKLIGMQLGKSDLPLSENILLLSGRASFELVQKAAMAGIPMMLAVGAPSSLAIELAEENEMTLVGFLKQDKMNIYSGNERIV